MIWHLKIQEPTGHVRQVPLRGSITVGRGDQNQVVLKDPTVPSVAAQIIKHEGEGVFWVKLHGLHTHACLNDLPVREALLPPKTCLRLGETQMWIEPERTSTPLPEHPSGLTAWRTSAGEGQRLLWSAYKAAQTPLSVYLAGETGTGKEVLAHLLHAWSARKAGPFVPLHCGALSPTLAESELFGHVKGAFTGAAMGRTGALLQAHNGTLFLDEIGDLTMDLQVKLLRFLENGEVRPVGADRTSRVDARVLCATHHCLKSLVGQGKFRQDLYYRLASITLEIPPLRSRLEDVELLANHYAGGFQRNLSPAAILRLQAYSWPGNVRELRHAVERACGYASGPSRTLSEDAFLFLGAAETTRSWVGAEGASLSLREMERAVLLRALKISNGNRAGAAKLMGVARSTIFEMLKRHQLRGPRTPDEPCSFLQ